MTTLNKVTLIGYLGHAPEMRTTSGGDPVAQFALATTETWKDKASGERKESTEWHRIVLYRKLAEVAGQYLKKGALVYVEGRMQTRKWTGKDGIERHTVEIVADDMRMLGGRRTGNDADTEADSGRALDNAPGKPQRTSMQPMQYAYEDDAIPF